MCQPHSQDAKNITLSDLSTINFSKTQGSEGKDRDRQGCHVALRLLLSRLPMRRMGHSKEGTWPATTCLPACLLPWLRADRMKEHAEAQRAERRRIPRA